MIHPTRSPLLLSVLLGLACSAEGADQEAQPARETPARPGPAADAGPGATDPAPAYLVGTRVWDDVSTTSYFHVLPSLERGTKVDAQKALEIPGAAKLYSVPGIGWFAVGGGDAPAITRYTLEGDRLVEQDGISLVGYGVSNLWDTLYVVSATKVYYPDRDGSQLIVINPEEMAIEGSIDLSDTVREGYLSLYGYASLTQGDRLSFSVGWFDWNETDSVLGETGLVVIDTQRDRVERVVSDERCGGVTQPVTMDTGETYLVSSALAGAAHRFGRLSTAPCALRLTEDVQGFDADYYVELADLADGAIAGEPVPAGGSRLFLRVFDETIGEVPDDGATWELTGQEAWLWYTWDVASDSFTRIDALEPSTSDVFWFEIDGTVFGTATNRQYTETTLLDLAGGGKKALRVPGFLHGVARIR